MVDADVGRRKEERARGATGAMARVAPDRPSTGSRRILKNIRRAPVSFPLSACDACGALSGCLLLLLLAGLFGGSKNLNRGHVERGDVVVREAESDWGRIRRMVVRENERER